jgi:hypothetical protein
VSGQVLGTGCSGRVRVDLNRGSRRLKSVSAPLRRCRYEVVLSTTARGSNRTISVRTVATKSLATARSKVVRVR